jgi:hypothetical protein
MEIHQRLCSSRRCPLANTTHNWTHCSKCPGYNISVRTIENTISKSNYIVACVFVAKGTEQLPRNSRCLQSPLSNASICHSIRLSKHSSRDKKSISLQIYNEDTWGGLWFESQLPHYGLTNEGREKFGKDVWSFQVHHGRETQARVQFTAAQLISNMQFSGQ